MPEIFFGAGETVPANNETGVTPAWPIFWVKGDVNLTSWGNALYWEEFVTLTEKGDSTLIPLKVTKYDRPKTLITNSAFDYRWPDGTVSSIRIEVLDNLKEDTQYTLNFIKGKLKDGSGSLVSDHKFPHTINFTTGKFLKIIPVNPINHQHNFPLTGWSFTYNTNMFMNYVTDYNFGFQRLRPSGSWGSSLHQGNDTSGMSASNGGMTRHYSVSRDLYPDRWFRIYWEGGIRRWLGENHIDLSGVKGNDDFDGVRLSFPGYMVNQYVFRYENHYVYFYTGDPSDSVVTDPLQATVSIGSIRYNSSFPFNITLNFNKEVRQPGGYKTVNNRFSEGDIVRPSFILKKQGITDLSLEQDSDGNYIHKEIKLTKSFLDSKKARLTWTHTNSTSGYYKNFQPGVIYELEIKDFLDYYGANVLEPLPIYTIEAPPHPNVHFSITDGATDVDYADPEAMQLHIDQNPNQSKWNTAHTDLNVQLHKQRSPGSIYYDRIDVADLTWVKTIGSENTSKSFDHGPNGNRWTATYFHYTLNVTGGLEPDTNYKFRWSFKQMVSNEYLYDINQVANYGSSFVDIQFKTKSAAPVAFNIDSITPADGATDVDAFESVSVDFNKEVDIDTIRNVPRGIVIQSAGGLFESVNWAISSDKKSVSSTPVVYEPSRQLGTGSIYHTSQYTTTVKSQVTATDGDTLGSDHVVTYEIAVHPTIYKTGYHHADQTISVPYTDFGTPVSTPVKIDHIPGVYFDQPMDESLIDDTTIWLEDSSGNKITDATYVTNEWWPVADTANKMSWVEIRPNNPLDYSTTYKLRVQGLGALTDTSGRKLHGHFTQYFTTETLGPDTDPPTVVSVTPADGSTDVVVSDTITVEFSENIDSFSINSVPRGIVIQDSEGNYIYTFWNVSGNKASFTPSDSSQYLKGSKSFGIFAPSDSSDPPHSEEKQYTATVKTTVTDTATVGNPIASEYSWTFTTEILPSVQEFYFYSAEKGSGVTVGFGEIPSEPIFPDSRITVRFDKLMNESLIDDTTVWLEDSSGNKISGTYFANDYTMGGSNFNAGKMTFLNITPDNPLDYSTTYNVVVKGDGVLEDTLGRKIWHDLVYSFITKDPAPNNFAHAIEIFPNGHYPPLKEIAKGTYPINHPFSEPVTTEFPTINFVHDVTTTLGDTNTSFEYSSRDAFGLRRKSDGVDIPINDTFGLAAIPGLPFRKAIRFTPTVALDDGVEYEFYANRSLILLQDGTVFNSDISDFVLKTFTADLTNQHSYNDVGPVLFEDSEYLGVNHNLCYYANPYITDPGGDNIVSGRPTLYAQFEDQISQATRDQTDLAWWVTIGDDITDWTKPKQSGDMKWSPAVDPDKNKLAWTSHATYPDETPLSLFIDVSRITNIKGKNAIASIFNKLGSPLPRSGNIVKVATFYVVRKPIPKSNKVVITNSHTNINYTFEFTNRIDGSPYTGVDNNFTVLQEDRNGQRYVIKVNQVWDSITEVQVKCTRDSVGMSSDVSQREPACGHTGDHDSLWFDRRNGASTWRQDLQAKNAYKGITTTPNVYVGNTPLWPVGDNSFFVKVSEQFCNEDDSSHFDTIFYFEHDPSATNTGEVPRLVGIVPKATSVDEGANLEFDVLTENIPDGTQLAWSLTNAGDFTNSTGFCTITSDAGTVSVSPDADQTTEGTEKFKAEIFYDGRKLGSVDVDILDTSLDPPAPPPPAVYTITPRLTDYNEGQTMEFDITVQNINLANIECVVVGLELADLEMPTTSLTQNVVLTSNAGVLAVATKQDLTTEGPQVFHVEMKVGGVVVASSVDVTLHDTSTAPSPPPPPPPPPPSTPAPTGGSGNVGGGVGGNTRGSGIYQEWFYYTPQSTEPAPVWREITDTQCITIDLSSRGAIAADNDAPIGQEPKDRPSDSFTAPDSYFLYARFMDKSKNISDLYNTSFKIDNFDPYTIERPPGNLLRINAGGHVKPAKILDDEVYVFQTVTDDHSGVVYYTHEVNAGNWTKEVLSTAYVSSKAAPDNEYMIDELITIGSTPGEYEVKVRPYDQAENFDENKFTVIRSSQSIIWHSLSGARSTTSPFIVEGTMKVEITGSPELIAGFYCSTDLYFHPPDSYFNTSHATHRIYDIPFTIMVPDMGVERAIMHIFTDGSPHRSYAQKDFSWSNSGNPTSGGGGNGNISSVDPPTVEIKEATQRLYTNSLTNNWGIFGDSGAIHVNGGKDRITGYIVNESSASPGAPPVYNTATQKFEDAASIGWNVYDTGAETFTEVENHTFTNTSYGSKTIYLHVATHAYNGTVHISGSPQTQTFSDSYTIEYIDDRIGPWVTVLNTTEDDTSITAAASKMNSYADSLYNPIEVFKRIEVLSTDNISMSGTLTDNESRIKRYTIGTYGSPPPYTELNPGQWTVLSTPAPTTNFTFSSTLTPPNSIKTFYIWAVDIVGNISKTLVQFELYNPNYIVPTIGAAGVGSPYKFEGKPDEHPNRESIASMFGDGTFHTGMISNQTSKVKANRIHKLSEYRGLRVANTANNDSYEFLPSAADPANPQAPHGEPIKFSDFLNKKPRIDDMAVVPTVMPHNVQHPSEPLYVGDKRNISLTMDIDTGNRSTPWKLANDNVVDDDATWTAVFIAPNAPSQVSISLPAPVNGVIQNYTFANEGTYIFTGLSSFGDTAGKVFIIIPPGTPVPPTQGPPINVVVPITTDPAGKTPVTIDYFIDQVGIGLDAAIAIDRSGSYVSDDPSYDDFAGALLDSLTTNQKVRVLLIENAVTPNPDYPKNPGDRWAVIAIFENIAGGSEKTSLIEAFPNMKYFLDYPSATSVPGQGGLNMSVNGGTVGDLAHLLTLPGSASLLQTGTGDYSELAQSIREGYDVTEPNAHGWQNMSGKNNRYWYTKAHHAEKTMLKALDEFSRSSKTNAADTRWRVCWYPLASSIGVDHVQGWSNVESKVFDAINIYKDSMGHSDEPKIQAVAELAKGMGLSASELPAWRKTAAKLILLFSDEQDGPGQNNIGSPAHYKNPSDPEYYIKHLTVPGEEIGLIVMDGDRDTSFKDPSEPAYNAGNAVYKKDNLQDAVALTSKYGGYLGKLRISSTGSDISDEVENAFDNYKAGVRFNLLSSIQNPQILTSNLVANTASGNHASGTMVPIPYNDLIPYPNAATTWRRRAVFDAELDNAAVNSLGVSYIILYVSVLNSSDMEIMRREVRIRVT